MALAALFVLADPVRAQALVVEPGDGLIASGFQGGPFSPAAKTYTLTNKGQAAISFAVMVDQNWLDAAPKTGILAPGASTTATISLNTAATALKEGDHSATITFKNETDKVDTTRKVNLTVKPSGAVILRVVTTEGDGTFNFSSSTPALVLSLTTSNGSAQSPSIRLDPGTYTATVSLPAGFALTSVTCSDGDSIGNVGARSATIVLAARETVTCTFAAVNARRKTVETISRFISRRNDQLLANDADTSRQIERLMEAGATPDTPGSPSGFVQGARAPRDTFGDIAMLGTAASAARRGGVLDAERRLLGQSVDTGSVFEPMKGGIGLPFRVMGGTDGSTQLSFSISLRQVLQYAAAQEANRLQAAEDGMSLAAKQPVMARVRPQAYDVWVEGRYFDFADDRNRSDSDGHLGVVYFGADYVVNPSFLIGALVQYDSMRMRSEIASSDVEGQGWMVGPYATFRLTDNVFLQARAAWGRSHNEISPFLNSRDDFDSERWLVRSTLTGSWQFGSWFFRPSASIGYISDTTGSYTDSLGVVIPSITSSLGQLKFGPEFAYRYRTADGITLEPQLALQGIWNFVHDLNGATAGDTVTGPEGLRGRVELGLKATTIDGIILGLSGSYDGIGSKSFDSVGGRAVVWIALN